MINLQAEEFIQGKTLLIDKEPDWTSFDLVNKIRISLRNTFGIKKIKVGHAGTLDPLATGLVIICTGKATKTIEKLTGLDKEYIAQITLGASTPSFDLETEIDHTFPYEHISREFFEDKLSEFQGSIEQVPPIYSAKQIDGRRAYDMARKGEVIKMKSNIVEIHHIEILNFTPPEITLKIECGKGTYIRSLAHDIGKALNSGAYLSGLKRTKIGDFNIKDAIKITDFVKNLKPL